MQEVTAEILIERVWAYCEKILSGEIKACQKHKWAVQRFFKDVEALADPECPFYYDAEAVLDFYEWARQFRHVEGILAGEPIELTDFKLFIAANVYGFFKKENGARRFRKVYIQLARKNAKSQFLALMASYEVFPTTEKHRVFIAGWSREQSDEVYQAILEQLLRNISAIVVDQASDLQHRPQKKARKSRREKSTHYRLEFTKAQ